MNNKTNIKMIFISLICLIVLIIGIVLLKNHDYYDNNKDELFSEISYDVLPEFKLDNSFHSSKYYNYDNGNIYCSFIVDADEKEYNDDFKTWFSKHIYYNLNDKVGELKEITINNNTMYYIDKISGYDTAYYYGLQTSNYYYFITYRITDYEKGDIEDIDTNLCYTAKDKFISTVTIK